MSCWEPKTINFLFPICRHGMKHTGVSASNRLNGLLRRFPKSRRDAKYYLLQRNDNQTLWCGPTLDRFQKSEDTSSITFCNGLEIKRFEAETPVFAIILWQHRCSRGSRLSYNNGGWTRRTCATAMIWTIHIDFGKIHHQHVNPYGYSTQIVFAPYTNCCSIFWTI